MFVPYRDKADQLDKCRMGEGNRAFSASAGDCVLAKGLVIGPYILGALRRHAPHANVTFNWRMPLSRNDLLLFEAFVTHETADHISCARLAAAKFWEMTKDYADFKSDIGGDEPGLNLLGAMLLRTGWSNDITMLSHPCLVVRHRGTRK